MLLHTRKVQNSARVDMPKDLQMLLLDVAFLTLPMQRLGQQITKLLIATVSPLFNLILNISFTNIQYLQICQNRSGSQTVLLGLE